MLIKYSLNMPATSLSSETSTLFSKRLITEKASIFSENSGLTVFKNFRFSIKHLTIQASVLVNFRLLQQLYTFVTSSLKCIPVFLGSFFIIPIVQAVGSVYYFQRAFVMKGLSIARMQFFF